MVKLDRLINVLGGFGARLGTAPRDRSVELRSVAVHDPADPATGEEDVLLAVGVDADAAAGLLARTRAAVVVFRCPELDGAVLAAAREWVEALDRAAAAAPKLALLELRYEDFCSDVHGALRTLLSHAELDPEVFPFGRCPRTLDLRNARWLDGARKAG